MFDSLLYQTEQEPEQKIFTLDDWRKMRERFKTPEPQVVGIVCKPAIEMAIREKIKRDESSRIPIVPMVAIEIHTDAEQEQDCLAFYSYDVMRAYLNRKAGPRKWAEAVLRDKVGPAFDRLFPDGLPE